MRNFFITGLPRSRTAWFASYFTFGGTLCWHEAMNRIRTRREYWDRMSLPGFDAIGNSDCGLFMDNAAAYVVGAPLVIIERSIDAVEASLARRGIHGIRGVLEESQEGLEAMDGLRIRFEDIDTRLEEIHDHLGIPYNAYRAKEFMNTNIQLPEIVPDPKSTLVWR